MGLILAALFLEQHPGKRCMDQHCGSQRLAGAEQGPKAPAVQVTHHLPQQIRGQHFCKQTELVLTTGRR